MDRIKMRKAKARPLVRVVRLSDNNMRAKVLEFNSKARVDSNFARQILQRAGIVTSSGRLKRRYS